MGAIYFSSDVPFFFFLFYPMYIFYVCDFIGHQCEDKLKQGMFMLRE